MTAHVPLPTLDYRQQLLTSCIELRDYQAEGVAQLRTQLEIMTVRVKEKHEIPEEKEPAAERQT